MNELETLEALQKLVDHIEKNNMEHLYEKINLPDSNLRIKKHYKSLLDKVQNYTVALYELKNIHPAR